MRLRTSIQCAASAALLAVDRVSAVQLDVNSQDSIKNAAKQVAKGMMNYYHGNEPGQTPGLLPAPVYWWQAGAMFGTLIDYWYYTGDSQYNDLTVQGLQFQVGNHNAFDPSNQTSTEGNDDQGFWALTAMSAAELRFQDPAPNQVPWLALVQAVFNQQAGRYVQNSDTCGGGLRWQIQSFAPGWNYKNSISQGCFFNMAARLGAYTQNSTYLDWAERSWNWTQQIGLITDKWEVFDGTSVSNNCSDWERIEWTYNNGIFLYGAAVMWNQTTGDKQALWKTRIEGLLDGQKIFFKDGVMTEQACEAAKNCNIDQFSFRAYLARWMAATTKLAPFTSDTILPLLKTTAVGAAQSCSGGTDGMTCGLSWTTGGYDNIYGVGLQMSALEAIQSNLVTSAAGPVTNTTGGTSKGDAGAGNINPNTEITFRPITTGDRAGAGIVTALLLIFTMSGGWYLVSS